MIPAREVALVTVLLYSPRFLDHDTQGLAETADRLSHTWSLLQRLGLTASVRLEAPRPATYQQIAAVHSRQVIDRLQQVCRRGGGLIAP
jgi:acetoin utilization deacetylase AcuC-like enzyme